MQQDATPTLPARSLIVLIALLQGLVLYITRNHADSWPFQDIAFRYGLNGWTLTIPSAIALTLVDPRDLRLWLHAALASLLVVALAAWVGANLNGVEGAWTASLSEPLALGLGVATFLVLPWWQFRLQHGHWRADYASLFERTWQNALVLLLAAVFTGLGWTLLWLWGALFTLVGIDFFHDLFSTRAFIAMATGCLAGFGILIGRTQHRAVQITRQVLFALCHALLPLLSFIAVLFVLMLPFTGLMHNNGYQSATRQLLTLALLLICLLNAAYQRQDSPRPYTPLVRRLVEAAVLALPIYSGLAIYAMAARIHQYGWTIERFWPLALAILTAGYAIGYAVAVLRRQPRWLQGLEPVNRVMCWAVVAVVLLGNSPVLDPARLTINSMVERTRHDPAHLEVSDARMLQTMVGHRGVAALRELQADPAVQADPRALGIIAQQLASGGKREFRKEDMVQAGVYDLASLKARIPLAQGSDSPPDAWWEALRNGLGPDACSEPDGDCLALQRDLDGDGTPEVLLCRVEKLAGPLCEVHVQRDQAWQKLGQVVLRVEDKTTALQALREGKLQLTPSRWPEFSLGSEPTTLQYDRH